MLREKKLKGLGERRGITFDDYVEIKDLKIFSPTFQVFDNHLNFEKQLKSNIPNQQLLEIASMNGNSNLSQVYKVKTLKH